MLIKNLWSKTVIFEGAPRDCEAAHRSGLGTRDRLWVAAHPYRPRGECLESPRTGPRLRASCQGAWTRYKQRYGIRHPRVKREGSWKSRLNCVSCERVFNQSGLCDDVGCAAAALPAARACAWVGRQPVWCNPVHHTSRCNGCGGNSNTHSSCRCSSPNDSCERTPASRGLPPARLVHSMPPRPWVRGGKVRCAATLAGAPHGPMLALVTGAQGGLRHCPHSPRSRH